METVSPVRVFHNLGTIASCQQGSLRQVAKWNERRMKQIRELCYTDVRCFQVSRLTVTERLQKTRLRGHRLSWILFDKGKALSNEKNLNFSLRFEICVLGNKRGLSAVIRTLEKCKHVLLILASTWNCAQTFSALEVSRSGDRPTAGKTLSLLISMNSVMVRVQGVVGNSCEVWTRSRQVSIGYVRGRREHVSNEKRESVNPKRPNTYTFSEALPTATNSHLRS